MALSDQLSEEDLQFGEIADALSLRRHHAADPELPHPLESSSVVQPFLETGDVAGSFRWDDWCIEVGRDSQDLPITRETVLSLYAPWQRFRAWTLLEKYTLYALLEPRTTKPSALYAPDWTADLSGQLRSWTTGNPRLDRLVQELEEDGWLSAIAHARAMIDWAELRAIDPEWARWPEGECLTQQQRWDLGRPRLEQRCRALALPWSTVADLSAAASADASVVPDAFRTQMRRMLGLWRLAVEGGHPLLAKAIRDEIYTGHEWAIFAFVTTFATVDSEVGQLNDYQETSLASVLEPTRHDARRKAEQHLPHFVEWFNKNIGVVRLDTGDGQRFLDYLDKTDVRAWYLELAGWIEREQTPTDTGRDRRFLHLRSLALLCEQVLAHLADEFGTHGDRRRIGTGNVIDTFKVFLADRDGWRRLLWQHVRENYSLTTTSERTGASTGATEPIASRVDPSAKLRARIQAIDSIAISTVAAAAAKEILVLIAIRNFGAHRFTRDADLLQEYAGRIARAGVCCPLLYWKIATSLG